MTNNLDNTLSKHVNSSKPSIWSVVFRYTIISSLLGVTFSILLYILDKHFSMLGMIALAIPCIIVFFMIGHYKKENNNEITFKKAFAIGILFFTFCGVFGWGFNYLYTNVIVPDFWEGFTAQMESMFERLGMSDEQIEVAIDRAMRNKNNQLIQLVNSLGSYLFIGAIFSAIAGAVLKSETNPLK
jgi:Ca2+/Na+ antiporter